MALRHRDVISLFLEHDYDRDGTQCGFLGSDPMGHQGQSIDEELIVIPSKRDASAGITYPPNYQSRCLFRVDAGRGYSSSAGEDILCLWPRDRTAESQHDPPMFIRRSATNPHATAPPSNAR